MCIHFDSHQAAVDFLLGKHWRWNGEIWTSRDGLCHARIHRFGNTSTVAVLAWEIEQDETSA